MAVTAWASASTFRGSTFERGVNGAGFCLATQRDAEVNEPATGSPGARDLQHPACDGRHPVFNGTKAGASKIVQDRFGAADVLVGQSVLIEPVSGLRGDVPTIPLWCSRIVGTETLDEEDTGTVEDPVYLTEIGMPIRTDQAVQQEAVEHEGEIVFG